MVPFAQKLSEAKYKKPMFRWLWLFRVDKAQRFQRVRATQRDEVTKNKKKYTFSTKKCKKGSQTHRQKGSDPLKKILMIVLCLSAMGCSAMSLQCGVDGDSSFVNINSAPQVLSQNSRNLAELCGFAYEVKE